MVRLVADANVFFAAMLKDGMTRELWFDTAHELLMPADMLDELAEHDREIGAKFRGSPQAYETLKLRLRKRARIIRRDDYLPYLPVASTLIGDSEDWVVLAAALCIGCDIWSNDADLKRQRRVRAWTTEELARNSQLI